MADFRHACCTPIRHMRPASPIRNSSNLLKLAAVLLISVPSWALAFERPMLWSSEEPEDAVWSPTNFPVLVTQTKFVAEELLNDFGNQSFLSWGAKKKGAPITLRLSNIEIPAGLDGVGSDLLFSRFLWFTRGNGDIQIGRNPKHADVDVSMKIVPTTANGERIFSLRVEARATRGRAKGKLLYSKSRLIQ